MTDPTEKPSMREYDRRLRRAEEVAALTAPDQYVLGYRRAEQERLQQQAEQLAHESRWLFDQVGVTAGARVVEIGCGPHGGLELLPGRCGPVGTAACAGRAR